MTELSIYKKIETIKAVNQDFEFYPTTQYMIDIIKADIGKEYINNKSYTLLDVGAGDGVTATKLGNGKVYAIEKSTKLIEMMDKSVIIVGTDFMNTTLIDKKTDITFSNPPYSIYDTFAEKIILESTSKIVYLIIPSRWKDNKKINDAITARKATFEIIGTGDFLEADRKARAYVDIVKIDLCRKYKGYSISSYNQQVDPFDLWFDTNFKIDIEDRQESPLSKKMSMMDEIYERKNSDTSVIESKGVVHLLTTLYDDKLSDMMQSYGSLQSIDSELLRELNVDKNSIKEGLKLKIENLKYTYWKALFEQMETITGKLTSKTRTTMLDKLFDNVSVDFTADNIYAIILWCVKSANVYYDDQLLDIFDTMVDQKNITAYKSNQRVFKDEDWRYRWCDERKNATHYKLDYRIVVSGIGGYNTCYWNTPKNGLHAGATNFLDDMLIIAKNLGFDTENTKRIADSERFDSGKSYDVTYYNHTKKEEEVLYTFRAYQNGNLHLKLNQKFILAINVEVGRLKGWVNSRENAADEMGENIKNISNVFNTNLQLGNKNLQLLLK